MPYLSSLVGVTKLVKANGNIVIVDSASIGDEMEVQGKNFVQGTIKNRIFNINGVSTNLSVSAPILIGGGASVDGRTLLTNQIANILNPKTTTLPVLKSANISVSKESAIVSLNLMSDGDPANAHYFTVVDGTAYDVLNPTVVGTTRTGTFYDFRVCLAGYIYLIKDAKITVDVDIDKEFFIPGKDGTTSDSAPIPTPNPWNIGTQFPFLAASGLRISGSGSAVALLNDKNGDGLYSYDPDPNVSESVNVILDGTTSSLTLQQPGQVITANKPFAIEVYDGVAKKYVSLFRQYGASVDLFDLSQSFVSKHDFRVSSGLLTVDFAFNCVVI